MCLSAWHRLAQNKHSPNISQIVIFPSFHPRLSSDDLFWVHLCLSLLPCRRRTPPGLETIHYEVLLWHVLRFPIFMLPLSQVVSFECLWPWMNWEGHKTHSKGLPPPRPLFSAFLYIRQTSETNSSERHFPEGWHRALCERYTPLPRAKALKIAL